MTEVKNAAAAILALGLLTGAAGAALAQAAQQQRVVPGMGQGGQGMMGQGMMQQRPQGMMGQDMGPGMMGQTPGGAMWHMGPHMMSPAEMQEMMEHMGAMMGPGAGPGMMAPGTMGQGMMSQGVGPGLMGQPGSGTGGWSGLEGRRVVPQMQLSTDDVREFFERYLDSLGNARLKVGKVDAVDADTITADVVTVDDSLVERFEVDRHTGVISAAG